MGQLHILAEKWLIIIIILQYVHIPKAMNTICFVVMRIMR